MRTASEISSMFHQSVKSRVCPFQIPLRRNLVRTLHLHWGPCCERQMRLRDYRETYTIVVAYYQPCTEVYRVVAATEASKLGGEVGSGMPRDPDGNNINN